MGDGPCEFSTSLDLALPYLPRLDPNGYYRRLGVETTSSRDEIRLRVLDLQADPTRDQAAIQTAAKVLLNVQARGDYDALPLGSVLADPQVLEAQRREAARRIQAETALARARSPRQFYYEEVDTPPEQVHDLILGWPWSYYVVGDEDQDTTSLEQAQTMLASAIAGRDSRKIALGIDKKMPEDWEVRRVGYRTVVFLRDTPTTQTINEITNQLTRRDTR